MEYSIENNANLRTQFLFNDEEEFLKTNDVISIKNWIESGEDDYFIS